MTRYKKYMKEHGFKYEEDYPYMPYTSLNGVTLESRDVFPTRHGLLEVAVYDVLVNRLFVLPNGEYMDIYEDDEEIPEIHDRQFEIRIYHDYPAYRFLFDEDDNLIAIHHTSIIDLI